MQCPQCGAENSDSASFCSLCYARFSPAPTERVIPADEYGPPTVSVIQGMPSAGDALPPEPPLPDSAPDTSLTVGDDPMDLPDSPGARLIHRGFELLEAGLPEAAFDSFTEALNAYQADGVASWNAMEAISNGLARSLAAQGRPADAAGHYLNVVRSKGMRLGMGAPELAAAWNRVGDAMFAGGMFADAEQIYGLALKVNGGVKDRVHALTKQAECFDALDRPADALMNRQKAETLAR